MQRNGCPFFVQDILGSVKNPDIKLSQASLSFLTGTVKSVGNLAKDTLNLGTSLLSQAGSLTGKIIDGTTGNIPIVKRASGAVSKTVTTVSDAPDATNTMLTKKCNVFYGGMVQHPK